MRGGRESEGYARVPALGCAATWCDVMRRSGSRLLGTASPMDRSALPLIHAFVVTHSSAFSSAIYFFHPQLGRWRGWDSSFFVWSIPGYGGALPCRAWAAEVRLIFVSEHNGIVRPGIWERRVGEEEREGRSGCAAGVTGSSACHLATLILLDVDPIRTQPWRQG